MTCTASVTYTPAADYFGSDEFTFTVSDGRAGLGAGDGDRHGRRGQRPAGGRRRQRRRRRLGRCRSTSPRCSPTTSPGPANEADQALTVTAVTAGAGHARHGRRSPAARSRTSPDAGFAGTATFAYTVCDDGTTAGQPDPLCADGVVTITVAPPPNEPPVGRPGDGRRRWRTRRRRSRSTGTDPDGDPLTFAVVAAPSHGTLTGTAPDLTYTPAADYFGPDELTFTVSDGAGDVGAGGRVDHGQRGQRSAGAPAPTASPASAGQTVTIDVADAAGQRRRRSGQRGRPGRSPSPRSRPAPTPTAR